MIKYHPIFGTYNTNRFFNELTADINNVGILVNDVNDPILITYFNGYFYTNEFEKTKGATVVTNFEKGVKIYGEPETWYGNLSISNF